MISQSGESTGSRNLATKSFTSNEDSLFQRLKTSELLKHLLNAREERKNSKSCDSYQHHIEKKSQSVVNQPNEKNESNSNKIVKAPLPGISLLSETVLSCVKSCNNGIMDKSYISDNSDVQCKDPLQRYLSDESSQSASQNECLSEDDLPILPNEMLSSETMDFILSEAQRNLHIESPPSSQNSQDCDSYEYTELLPANKLNSYFSLSPDSEPQQSTSKCDSRFTPAASDQKAKSTKNHDEAKKDNDSDSDVDKEMVLVPAGKFFRIIIPYISKLDIN